tara:strand:+ start:253 stop:1647 length:1395 start_codon:yes stop_codon:yes gene_type:complete
MKQILIGIISLTLAFSPLAPALASTSFNANFLISDDEFTDVFSMDRNDIQRILDKGGLSDYFTEDIDGRTRHIADIIWWTAQMRGISPKVLLVMLQKEQSLIEDPTPSQDQLDWALGYGVCDDCTHDDPDIQRWSGISKQLNSAALQLNEGYLQDIEDDGYTVMGYGPGLTSKIDDEYITFTNAATAALYTYTPHLHGNELFVTIWNRYFGIYYPSGSLLQDNTTGGVYLIKFDEKRPITSQTALLSRYNSDLIIPVDPTVLQTYADGAPISHANYSLLQTPTGGIYLLVDDVIRPIASQEAFRVIGFNPDEVIAVEWEDLAAYSEGETITEDSAYPVGTLLQNTTTGGVYFVEDGIKQPLMSRDVLDNRFAGWAIIPMTPEELDEFETGDPAKFFDGTLVKGPDPDVYVISEGERRPIPSEEVFLGLGWQWENIVVTDERTLELHPLGDTVYISTDEIEAATN